ncbi:MAG: hypothetical protein P4L33_04870 [Capsulimonadaceae bacterium]|nr:hypothetical protein [Capsulimonadaceae bacterium]
MEPQQDCPASGSSIADNAGICINQTASNNLLLVLPASAKDEGASDTVQVSAPLARAFLAELISQDEILAELCVCRRDVEVAVGQLDLMLSPYLAV